jgi:hypothetical protein
MLFGFPLEYAFSFTGIASKHLRCLIWEFRQGAASEIARLARRTSRRRVEALTVQTNGFGFLLRVRT